MADEMKLTYMQDLIRKNAEKHGDKTYIHFEEEKISFDAFYKLNCKVVNGLCDRGAEPGDGVAILMGNCPEYLSVFYGMPMGGFYTVPINVALKGEGLRFILTNSDVKYLVADDDLYSKIMKFETPVESIKEVFIRRTSDAPLPDGTTDLSDLFDASSQQPAHEMEEDVLAFLMYTSGTTGLPKGVVNRTRKGAAEWFEFQAGNMLTDDDMLYTCLPLFHANALLLTVGWAMGAGIPFGLDRKFTASGFWDRIRYYGVTMFNGLGAMIPILMKQPEKENDRDNKVRVVQSAACPSNLWLKFEERFDVKIWEGYGAVDGGGVSISNPGTAPVGSVGKPDPAVEWKLIDDDGNDVPQGEPGELITKVVETNRPVVEYYKNPGASAKKFQGDWLHSGDLFTMDKEGYLYFADRKTDSMRRRGENISSWEVENSIEKYDDVAVCAAFGVPSELGEDEVMVWIKPREGVTLDLKDLINFCAEHMAYFMIPRFIDIVDDIPRTGTLRVKKTAMKKQGVTPRTWDREKQMPEHTKKSH